MPDNHAILGDMSETQRPFIKGDRVFNTGNVKRKTIGIITSVIDDEYCTVLWSDGEGYAYESTIPRDGSVTYSGVPGREADRIVRVKLSVTLPKGV